MAPEQCDPARFGEIGPATDVWGLGVTLYEALTRTLPYARQRGGERFPQLGAPPPPPPAGVPAPVAEAVLWCLQQDPSARPAAAALAAELEPLVASLPAPRLGRFRPGAARTVGDASRRARRPPR